MAKTITKIPHLPKRAADAHKGDFGKVLIIGGSRGMVGAPALAGLAALRSGAGLVRIATPASIQLTVAQMVRCATTIPLAEDENGRLERTAISEIINAIGDSDAVAIGPGLSQSVNLQTIVETVIDECSKPLVIDADGLNNLAACGTGVLDHLTEKSVLTPHPGEMRRLWRAVFREELPSDRTCQAEKLADRCGCVVVLKGAETVVTDGKQTYINTTGNPGMATGGSGDVLTGIIATLAAGGMDILNTSVLAVYAHGTAGDLAADRHSQTAMIADDIIDALGETWRKISGI